MQGSVKQTPGYVPYEEIDAKKTSKLGYFFLLLMVVFGIWQGNNFFDSLENLVTTPDQNSICLSRMESSLAGYSGGSYYSGYYSGDDSLVSSKCKFTQREIIRGISDVYTTVYPEYLQVESLENSLSDISSRKYSAKNSRGQAVDDYSVSLLESIAQKNQIMNMGSLRTSIVTSDDLLSSLSSMEDDLKGKIANEKDKISTLLESHRVAFKAVDDAYALELNINELERFALRLLFIFPMFFFVWRRYTSSKNSRSEFSVIWGGVVAIGAVLLAQIFLVFVYRILPHELLQRVFVFLSNFKFFFVIAYWLGFILVPLLFGSLIYFIQKKYYNKKAIEMRSFKANKCPTCTMAVAQHMVYCPTCGTTLKVKCILCGGNTPKAGDFCELCGSKKVEKEAFTLDTSVITK